MNPRPLRRAAGLAVLGACMMTAVLIYAAWYGDFRVEGNRLLQMPWGLATLLDVYIGLALFSGWILWRETSRLTAAAWVVLILVTGNLGTCCYVLRAVLTSGNTPVEFWTGGNYEA